MRRVGAETGSAMGVPQGPAPGTREPEGGHSFSPTPPHHHSPPGSTSAPRNLVHTAEQGRVAPGPHSSRVLPPRAQHSITGIGGFQPHPRLAV